MREFLFAWNALLVLGGGASLLRTHWGGGRQYLTYSLGGVVELDGFSFPSKCPVKGGVSAHSRRSCKVRAILSIWGVIC